MATCIAPTRTPLTLPVVRLKIRVKLQDGSRRFLNPVTSSNGKVRAQYALVDGHPEHHPEGVYALRYLRGGVRVYQTVGSDAQLAVTAKLRLEHTLSAAALGIAPTSAEPVEVGDTTMVGDAITEYLQDTKQLKSKKTHAAYRITLQGFRSTCPEIRYMRDIKRRDILLYMAELKRSGMAPRTVANRVDFLKIFFNRHSIKWPMEKTDRVKYTEKEVTAYSVQEIATMLRFADLDEKDLVLFFLQTGAREQEVQSAYWTNLDFDRKTFTVRERLDIQFTPKDKEEGSVPIPDSLIESLLDRRRRYPKSRLIFAAPNGSIEGHYLRIIKSLALRAGLNCGHCFNKKGLCCVSHPVCRRYILHKFRKTFATMHHEAGVPVRTISKWLRHSDLETTMRYLAASDNHSQQTRGRVNATFAAFSPSGENEP